MYCSFLERGVRHSDSRGYTGSLTVRSKPVIILWAIASSFFHIRLLWVPGQSGIAGNCKADELAKGGTLTPISSDWKRVGLPMPSCVLALDFWTSREYSKPWSKTWTCATARSFWPRVNRKRSYELLALNTKDKYLSMWVSIDIEATLLPNLAYRTIN